jgi:hypothetical protein
MDDNPRHYRTCCEAMAYAFRLGSGGDGSTSLARITAPQDGLHVLFGSHPIPIKFCPWCGSGNCLALTFDDGIDGSFALGD